MDHDLQDYEDPTADTNVAVDVRVIMQADVLTGKVAGFDAVMLQFTVRNIVTDEDEYLILACDSQDAKRIRDRINTVAATVRPLDKQLKAAGLVADNGTMTSKEDFRK